MIKKHIKFMSIVFLFLFSSNTSATVLLRVSVDELVSKADLVFQGTVAFVKVIENESGGSISIHTEIVFNVSKVFRGKINDKTFMLKLLGGKGKKYMMPIQGMPQFEKGEEVLLFLEKTSKGFVPMGLIQGKFRITTDKNTKMASRTLAGAAFGSFDENGKLRISVPKDNIETYSLDEIIKKIESVQQKPNK